MKTLTCKELGGKCDQKFPAATWDELAQALGAYQPTPTHPTVTSLLLCFH